MAEMILFTGRKGGTGKTTVCAVTAGRAAKLGKRVLVLEAAARTMDMLYHVADKVVYDWKDAVEDRCTLAEARVTVLEDRSTGLLHLLCAPSNEEVISGACVSRIVRELGGEYDYIFVDVDGSEEDALRAFASYASSAIIVTTAERSGARRNEKVSSLLYDTGMENIRLCINQLSGDFLKQRTIPDLDWMIDTVCAQLIAVIPFDPVLASAPNIRYLVDSSSKIAVFFDNLAQRIMGNHIDLSVW